MSETNPARHRSRDRATDHRAASPLQIAGIRFDVHGTNLATGHSGFDYDHRLRFADSDNSGDLVLTGEADQEIVFVHNPGTPANRELSWRCWGRMD